MCLNTYSNGGSGSFYKLPELQSSVYAFIQNNPKSMHQHAQELKVSVLKEKNLIKVLPL